MAGLSVAVVGAGIGGLATALALAADGHDITVIEKRIGFAEPGAGIQLSPNAIKALGTLGVAPPRHAVEPVGITIRSVRSGTVLTEVALGPAMRERYGAPYLVAARADLHTVLLDAVRARTGVRLLVGRAVVGLQQDAERVGLTFAGSGNNRTEAEFNAAIGADGVGSAIRRLVGTPEVARPNGFVAARAVIAASVMPDDIGPDRTGLWWGPGGHVVHYPIDGGRAVNLVAIMRGELNGAGWSEVIEAARVPTGFAKACAPLRQLLATPDGWTAWGLSDARQITLAEGRVALVGDAAHPVLPYFAQGGALALEDAVVLAQALRQHPTPSAAFAAYARERRPRVRRVQEEARSNGRVFHLGGAVALARNLVLRVRPPAPGRFDWLYGWTPPGA